ncbi:hypothetical protein Tco_0950989 [Tanacetum coccineum]|uniref:Uncharacterized protein n=1 Tax=Tanacetum coccineum TaxID=301880 RepID=A0ABQ5DTT3_9ASTR
MNPQETQQVITRDERWVPSTERVKISSTNVRLEATVHQKEETFQVIIDVIKNSTCIKAFTISIDVPEIFMQQFWYTIKKVKDSESYEFLLANKKCIIDAEVFRKILDICPRVKGKEFTKVQDDDATLTFLIDLGYKGPPHKSTNMYVDHMHQPWRTLVAIINKCLSGKTTSNDRLRKSRIDILKKKKSRREIMSFLRFTKDDGIVSRLKLLRIGKDYQEYGLPITDMMRNDQIKQSESYQMVIKYSTRQIPPKKSRSKGSQGKKTTDTAKATVDVYEESDPEPARKRTANRRVVKKKVTIFVADNIIPDPDVALELGKSISLPKVAEEEAASEGTGTKLGVPDEEKVTSEANIYSDEDDQKKDDVDDDRSIDLEMTDDEESDDEFVHDDEQLNDNEDEEMTNAKVKEFGKGDAEISNVAKAYAKKIEEIKDDAKKAELPPTSSNLSDTTDAEINSLLDIKIQSKVPHIQSPFVLTVPVLVISKPSVLTPIPKTPSVAPVITILTPLSVSTIPPVPHQTTVPIPTPPIITDDPTIITAIPESDALSVVQLRVSKLEKDVSELKKIDHSIEALATLKSQVPIKYSVKPTPESSKIQKPTVDPEQESEKGASEIRKVKKELAEKQKMPKYTIKSTDKATLKEYD